MRFLLAAINAKYIHSNLAVYSLRAYAKHRMPEMEIQLGEYTINHQMDLILQDIYKRKPDVIGFAWYIWNIQYVKAFLQDIPKILPDTEIWLGGPEVSYHAKEVLEQFPNVRGVMVGEGEETFSDLVRYYCASREQCEGQEAESFLWNHEMAKKMAGIPGIVFRDVDGIVKETAPRGIMNLDDLPFPYEDLKDLEHRIIYYESSRGCPFSCSYCLSSIDKSVRFRSLELVRRELDFFLERRVPQVFLKKTKR